MSMCLQVHPIPSLALYLKSGPSPVHLLTPRPPRSLSSARAHSASPLRITSRRADSETWSCSIGLSSCLRGMQRVRTLTKVCTSSTAFCSYYSLHRIHHACATMKCASMTRTRLTKEFGCIASVVRSSYGDRFYTRLGREAIAMWKDPMWQGCYHE